MQRMFRSTSSTGSNGETQGKCYLVAFMLFFCGSGVLLLCTMMFVVWPFVPIVCSKIDDSSALEYIRWVYGDDDLSKGPNLCELSMLYNDVLEFVGISMQFATADYSTCVEGGLYRRRVWLDSEEYRMIYHGDRTALPNDTWVEVTHCALRTESKHQYWMYHTPGSGVWINTGRTLVYNQHRDFSIEWAFTTDLNVSYLYEEMEDDVSNEQLQLKFALEQIRRAGYTTVQFLHHSDQNCGNMAVEIVDVNWSGSEACGPPMRAGYNASRPCSCFPDVRKTAGGNYLDFIPQMRYGTPYTTCARCVFDSITLAETTE